LSNSAACDFLLPLIFTTDFTSDFQVVSYFYVIYKQPIYASDFNVAQIIWWNSNYVLCDSLSRRVRRFCSRTCSYYILCNQMNN